MISARISKRMMTANFWEVIFKSQRVMSRLLPPNNNSLLTHKKSK